MKRRNFLAGMAVGSAAISAPAIAQGGPEIQWRLTSNAPKSLDAIYGTAEHIARRVAAATNGRFRIQTFAAGEIVPATAVLDAVQNQTVEMGHTASSFHIGKDPTFAIDTALPFGLNARQQSAWMYHGGGLELMREFFRNYQVFVMPAGNSGAQMGGWFRREVNTLDDLKGLKLRIGGLASQVFQRLGAVPQQIAPGDIYPALEKGTIDAAEWIGPYDDEKLGLQKVAKYYYYPGFWEGNTQTSLYVNLSKWESLPEDYKAIVQAAAAEGNQWMTAKYDAENPAALRRLLSGGAILKPFSRDILTAAYKTAFALYDEIAAANPNFRKIYQSWLPFRREAHLWWRVAELPFDNFVVSQSSQR